MAASPIELLAPAGALETAWAALDAGADAVYLGLDAFSARAEAVNFTPDQVRLLLGKAHADGKKVYITFNTVIDNADLPAACEKLALLEDLGPDGVIVQDLGIARLIRTSFPGLALHASTQLVAHNLEGVLALKEIGFTRVVLAREVPLEDIRTIASRSGVEIEVFVHGALCYSLSGLCLFSALEKERSGNRGKCAYCCRLGYTDATGEKTLPFSMRDLRLDDRLDDLREAGVASLKIEGRMKSALYVATVTRHYRELLDGRPTTVSRADLETVFSRRTTSLYLGGYDAHDPVIDPLSLGHLGTPIGTVKRLTRDRENRTWLRFHTTRALERHDGLQFAAPGGGKPMGFGISEMRGSLSRHPVFEIQAGTDVEVRVPEELLASPDNPFAHGATVYCSASNSLKRRFPTPSCRPSEIVSGTPVDITVTLAPTHFTARAPAWHVEVNVPVNVTSAKVPEKTIDAVRKAFFRLGETQWRLDELTLEDPDGLFAPASMLNDLRRQLVTALDAAREKRRAAKIADALAACESLGTLPPQPTRQVLKLRLDQPLPNDCSIYDEIIVQIGHRTGADADDILNHAFASVIDKVRLALPVFTPEASFNALRSAVRHLIRSGYTRWEAADLATLRVLKHAGITDITADWTLYAFNAAAVRALQDLGITRFVASPENTPDNLRDLMHYGAEGLIRQSTPLFISLTRPAAREPSLLTGLKGDTYQSFQLDNLWVTVRPEPRTFSPPVGTHRLDLSWDAD